MLPTFVLPTLLIEEITREYALIKLGYHNDDPEALVKEMEAGKPIESAFSIFTAEEDSE